ncbi:MAG: trypsin-like peptidase domain-containing protein [Candidatus Saccharibacteria bacterium]
MGAKKSIQVAALKTVKIKPHHVKVYRKRHIVSLVTLSIAVLVLLALVFQYKVQLANGFVSSQNFIADNFSSKNDSYDLRIHSTYGFDVHYDQKQFYASAIDASNGQLFLGTELNVNRAYNVVRIAPSWVGNEAAQSTLTINYHQEFVQKQNVDLNTQYVEAVALKDSSLTADQLDKLSTKVVNVGGTKFQKTVWQLKQSNAVVSGLKIQFVTYAGIVNHKPVTIVINQGLGKSNADELYGNVISSVYFGANKQAFVAPTAEVVARTSANRSLMDTILFSQVASAATTGQSNSTTEKIAALYSPAVVKIYNVYCMDIDINGKPYLTAVCSGLSGSGFFVSKDGYIATNGHVASASPKDIVISDAVSAATKGNADYLLGLLSMTNFKESDIPTNSTAENTMGIVIDKLYSIPDSSITSKNSTVNLLVDLTDKQPDVTELAKLTKAGSSYPVQDTIKHAKLVNINYRAMDGIGGFKASDVALIKVEGDNYPVLELGVIGDAGQGADLSIFGYPGQATDNGLVDAKTSTVTLTSGKVSSVKNASGSDKKLIETDTTIGHGNSGGPVLVDSGKVVGIATYTIDGSGSGNGVFNYIRDIKDLIDLAASSSVTLNTDSTTQSEWQKGIDNFYTSHYSKSIVNFNKVKQLYPAHPKVDSFISGAQERIKNGQDVQDFPVVAVVSVAAVLIIGITVTILLVVRHKKHHDIYKTQVASGAMQPLTPNTPPQTVAVVPPAPTSIPVTPYDAVPGVPVMTSYTQGVSTLAQVPVSQPIMQNNYAQPVPAPRPSLSMSQDVTPAFQSAPVQSVQIPIQTQVASPYWPTPEVAPENTTNFQ